MKKVVLIIICCLSVLLITAGCDKEINNKTINTYLQNKYNKEFVYVSEGNDVWSSTTSTKIYSDQNKKQFKIKINGDYFSDNYYSVIYDEDISKYYQKQLNSNYKVFVSSESNFTNNSKKYNGANEYLDDIEILNMAIYTTDNIVEEIESKLNLLTINNNYVSGVIYIVSNDSFINITSHANSVDIINSKSFSFTNGVLDKE